MATKFKSHYSFKGILEKNTTKKLIKKRDKSVQKI